MPGGLEVVEQPDQVGAIGLQAELRPMAAESRAAAERAIDEEWEPARTA